VSVVDYKAHATREAAVVLDECDSAIYFPGVSRDVILTLMAACWLQGANYGSHETLALIEADFQRVRAEL
jgi:hypothetical protein